MADVTLRIPAVRAEGLTKAYAGAQGPVEVLRGVDFEAAPGELIAILGPSGSGKSTLLNLLGLMDRPTSGSLKLFGREAAGLSEPERAALRNERVGFIFQFDSLLPEFSVLENVMMPGLIRGAADPGRARELLSRFGLAGFEDRRPRELSGGERQRAAVARALFDALGLVLADEPTGNLDRRNGEMVFSDLRRMAVEFKVAVVLVTHNENASSYAHRTRHLSDGRFDQP